MAGGETLTRKSQEILETVRIAARLGDAEPILIAMMMIPMFARMVMIIGAKRKVKMATNAKICHAGSLLCKSDGSQVIMIGM